MYSFLPPGLHFLLFLVCKSCPTLCNPMGYRLPGSSVHGILQARILEWVAIPFSLKSSWLRDWTRISCIGRRILYHWATWEAPWSAYLLLKTAITICVSVFSLLKSTLFLFQVLLKTLLPLGSLLLFPILRILYVSTSLYQHILFLHCECHIYLAYHPCCILVPSWCFTYIKFSI